MFALPHARHHQIAYATNDLDRAIALFEQDYGAPGFFVFNYASEDPGGPEIRIALSNVGGVQIELIEPIGDSAPLYRDVLEPGPELDICFHHVAIRIEGPIENWNAHEASLDLAAHPIVFRGASGDDLRFIYTDERARLGHYVEHMWLSPSTLEQLKAAIPRYPPEA
jgi:hypothetical protein